MRIVIVDGKVEDRAAVEKALSGMTGRETYEIVGTAADGKEGCELIRILKPDLVILDIQLHGMNGLSMIKKLQEEQIFCRTLVLTSETDFKRARQAIQLGVDDYLLKPVKRGQIQKAVLNIKNKLAEDQAMESALSAENIFMGCLNGQIRSSEKFNEITKERYGFSLEDSGALFAVWIGSGYMEQRESVRELLENATKGKRFSVCVIPIDVWHLLTVVVYRPHIPDSKQKSDSAGEYEIFRDQIMPALSGSVKGELVCLWEEVQKLKDLLEVLRNMRRLREWNLLYDRGELIRGTDIEALETAPLKYPAELESQVRQAVLSSDGEGIKKCYYRLYDVLRREPYSPREIKECLIRYNMAVLNAYKTQYEISSELTIQRSMQKIADAMSWGGIRSAMETFFHALDFHAFEEEGDQELSPLIRKAVQMVRKYYDQGITLEEMAMRLFVSEEYLSTQFKKETGAGFADTVRSLRIERIKGLLLNTRLKINQIAELTGYTDPKYMSRVFKDEVGMLPTEFRKAAH